MAFYFVKIRVDSISNTIKLDINIHQTNLNVSWHIFIWEGNRVDRFCLLNGQRKEELRAKIFSDKNIERI